MRGVNVKGYTLCKGCSEGQHRDHTPTINADEVRHYGVTIASGPAHPCMCDLCEAA